VRVFFRQFTEGVKRGVFILVMKAAGIVFCGVFVLAGEVWLTVALVLSAPWVDHLPGPDDGPGSDQLFRAFAIALVVQEAVS
jgi:hypothetical protein